MIEFFPSRTSIVEFFGITVYWYGFLYLLAFAIAWWWLTRLQRYRQLTPTSDEWLFLFTSALAGVVIGGRLGYVLLYEPQYFITNPSQIFAIWQGGMSSHGGIVGVAVALFLACRKLRIDTLALLDIVVIPAALGLALGRLGNFINQELFGTVSSLPWAMHFAGAEGLRHPTQLYALAKDLFITIICYASLRTTKKKGRTLAIFLILYSVLRFLVEYVRAQDYPLISAGFLELSRGQLYTIPLFILGLWLWRYSINHSAKTPSTYKLEPLT